MGTGQGLMGEGDTGAGVREQARGPRVEGMERSLRIIPKQNNAESYDKGCIPGSRAAEGEPLGIIGGGF